MSFNASIDTLAPTASQDSEIQVLNARRRNRHLTLAEMRGVIPLFKKYFEIYDSKGRKKRLSRDEKNKRWISYKQKIHRDYGRSITGNFSSEQALIKRYSDPLCFIKYRLKRATNLNVSHLSSQDQDYYKEIGGLEDVQKLIEQQENIDSIQKQMRRSLPRKRQRIDSFDIENASVEDHDDSRNKNNGVVSEQFPPQVPVATMKDESGMNTALDQLNKDLGVFEQEQLEKKKLEAFQITQEKIKSFLAGIKELLDAKPEWIGCIPGAGSLEDQLTVAFDFWLNSHILKIRQQITDWNIFAEQLIVLRQDHVEWNNFLNKWKIKRILYNDKFELIWSFITNELGIELTNSKNEADDDSDDDVVTGLIC